MRPAIWKASPGPQTAFLQCPADECLYGGAAGGGKSDALLAEALRQVENPQYRALILRRTFPELEQAKGLIDRSKQLYPHLGATYSEMRHRWTFPSGALIDFGHMQRPDDRYKYQGSEYAYIAFDELTHFTEAQYLYLFSRCRAAAGSDLRCYMRAGTNPGGIGHEWVKKRWGAWLDKKHESPAEAGELRWYARIDDSDTQVERSHPDAKSRTFIPARVADNPYLAGTDYERNLRMLQMVERMRLLGGDWDVMAAAGTVLRREWFEFVDAAPAKARRVRYWDLAASEKKTKGDDPDYTARALVSLYDGIYYIEHVGRARLRWRGVKKLIAQTAEIDGAGVRIGVEQEPGASGKALIDEIVSMEGISGRFAVKGYPAVKDKVARANPWAAQAEAGNVKIVRGNWDVDAFLNECDMFPEGPHDDQIDAVSGAVGMLAYSGPRWAIV